MMTTTMVLILAQYTWSGPVNLQAAPVHPEDSSAMLLTWQEGGAMGQQGYERYDTYGIYSSTTDPGAWPDEAWFDQAIRSTDAPPVVEPEEPVSFVLAGLVADTSYHFAVRGEYWGPDTYPTGPTMAAGATPPDGGAPSPVTLQVDSTTDTEILLSWTAPGDDGDGPSATSRARIYALRVSTTPPSSFASPAAWYAAAAPMGLAPDPATVGALQTMTVSPLAPDTTHWLAMVAVDELGQASPVVAVASALTKTAPPKAEDDEERGCLGSATATFDGLLLVALVAVGALRRQPAVTSGRIPLGAFEA